MADTHTKVVFIPMIFYVFLLLISPFSHAEFNATLTAKTDYIWRGYSKTSEKLAFQANLDYEHISGGYFGVSVANVDFDDNKFKNPTKIEISPYLGWTLKLSDDWRLDAQWTRYFYDGDIFGHHSDYNEFYLLLHYRDIFSINTSFSDDFYNQGHTAGNYELSGRHPFTDSIEFSTSVGYSQVKNILEYDNLYWNAGLTYYYKFIAVDLRYFDAKQMKDEIKSQWLYDPELLEPSLVFSISLGI